MGKEGQLSDLNSGLCVPRAAVPWRLLLIHSVLRFIYIERIYTKGQAHCGHGARGATVSKAAVNLCPRETTGQEASTAREVTGMCYMLGEMLGCKDA